MPIKISIIIATYNAADVLPGCLDSIKAQTYPHLEVIVADGASTDGTQEILKAYESKLNLRWMSEPDKSLGDAWNKALPKAGGDWIYFLGADDRLHCPESMARAAERLVLPAGTLLAYGQVRPVYPNGDSHIYGSPWEEVREKMLLTLTIPHQGTFHSPAFFERVGTFDASLSYSPDYKLILQSLPHAAPFYLGEVVIADSHLEGMTSLRKDRWSNLMEQRRFLRELGYKVEWWERRRFVRYAKALVWHVVAFMAGKETYKSKNRKRRAKMNQPSQSQ